MILALDLEPVADVRDGVGLIGPNEPPSHATGVCLQLLLLLVLLDYMT